MVITWGILGGLVIVAFLTTAMVNLAMLDSYETAAVTFHHFAKQEGHVLTLACKTLQTQWRVRALKRELGGAEAARRDPEWRRLQRKAYMCRIALRQEISSSQKIKSSNAPMTTYNLLHQILTKTSALHDELRTDEEGVATRLRRLESRVDGLAKTSADTLEVLRRIEAAVARK